MRGTGAGRSEGPLFGLAPDGVFRASSLALGAAGSYPAFSPLPGLEDRAVCFLWHYPSGRLAAPPPACISGSAANGRRRSYAASRPLVFGLSSPAPPQRVGSGPPPFQNQLIVASKRLVIKRRLARALRAGRISSLPRNRSAPAERSGDGALTVTVESGVALRLRPHSIQPLADEHGGTLKMRPFMLERRPETA